MAQFEYELTREGSIVYFKVLSQPKYWVRKDGMSSIATLWTCEETHIRVISSGGPELQTSTIYIRGSSPSRDTARVHFFCSSEIEAEQRMSLYERTLVLFNEMLDQLHPVLPSGGEMFFFD